MKKRIAFIVASIACFLLLTAGYIPTEEIGSQFLRAAVTDEIIECAEDKSCKYHEASNSYTAGVTLIVGVILEDSGKLTNAIRESRKQPSSQPAKVPK